MLQRNVVELDPWEYWILPHQELVKIWKTIGVFNRFKKRYTKPFHTYTHTQTVSSRS